MIALLKNNKPLQVLLFIGLVARLTILFFYPDQNFPDAGGYRNAGRHFFETGILGSNLHMPLYIIWTHLTGGDFYLKLSDILFSVLTIILIYGLSLHMFKKKSIALIAAGISSLFPHFLFYATSKLTETSYIFFLLLGIWLLFEKKYWTAFIILVLSNLIRPSLDLYLPVLVFIFCFFIEKQDWKTILKKLGQYGFIYVLLMSPWWAHNYAKYGQFVRLNLGLGFTLYSGNNPKNESGGGVNNVDGEDIDFSNLPQTNDPIKYDNALKDRAIEFIKENPKKFIKLAGLKFIRFWRLWPYTPQYQAWKYIITSLLGYGVVLTLFLYFLITQPKKWFDVKLFPAYSLILYLTAVHMILIGSIRYRLPIEPFLIIFASFSLAKIFEKQAKQLEKI